jgi:hypothetical protein
VSAGRFDDAREFLKRGTPSQVPCPHSISPHFRDGHHAIGDAQAELALNVLPAPKLRIFNRKSFLAARVTENASRPVAYPPNN